MRNPPESRQGERFQTREDVSTPANLLTRAIGMKKR
jgi:hypothetical protein